MLLALGATAPGCLKPLLIDRVRFVRREVAAVDRRALAEGQLRVDIQVHDLVPVVVVEVVDHFVTLTGTTTASLHSPVPLLILSAAACAFSRLL